MRPSSPRPVASCSSPPHCLKKNATPARAALVADVDHPGRVHRPARRAGLAADDHPVDAARSRSGSGPSSGSSERNLTCARVGRRSSMRWTIPRVLDAHAHPDVRRPRQLGAPAPRSRSARLVSTWNWCQCALRITSNAAWMKASGTSSWNRSLIEFTKIGLRPLPPQRQIEHLRLERELEAVHVVGLPHRLQPPRHALGVAVRAARAHLVAAGDRVPRGFGPFNRRAGGHQTAPFWRYLSKISPTIFAPVAFIDAKYR